LLPGATGHGVSTSTLLWAYLDVKRAAAKISGLFIRRQPKSDVETGNSRGGTSSAHTLSSGDFEGAGGSLKAAPNISLNLHGGSKTEDLCFTALCSILLQFGVLAMSGLAVYHPVWKLQFQKNGAPVLGYAYPIMSIGTVILVSGIMICSAVVEQSTYETKWVEGRKYGNLFRKQSQTNLQTPTHGSSAEVACPSWELTDSGSSTLSAESALLSIKSASDTEEQSDSIIQNIENTSHVSSALAWVGFSAGAIANPWPLQLPPKLRARVLWLQKSHTVSDQRFDAFVIIAQELRNVILTSRRSRNTLEDNLRLHDEPDEQSTGQRKPRRIASNSFEAFTVAGVGLSLVGFILQFQGLRGLHWSASISQLVAIFLMTVLRAWVRRGLIAEPSAYRVLDGYQMDWLALHMTADPKLWMKDGPAEQNLDGSKPGESNTAAMSGGKFATPSGGTSTKAESIPEWFIITDPPQYACQGSWIKADVHTDTTHNGDAQKTMKIRQRLGYLTRWTGPASIPAISVARAIAMVMEKLSITAPPDCQSFSWYLDVRFIGLQDQLQFTVSACEEKCNSWVVDATEIESAISLWAFYIQSNEKHELMKDVHSPRNAKGHGNNDWLQEDTLLRRQTRRLLGPASEALMMDLRLWVGEGVDPVPLNRKDDKGLLVGFQGLGSTAGKRHNSVSLSNMEASECPTYTFCHNNQTIEFVHELIYGFTHRPRCLIRSFRSSARAIACPAHIFSVHVGYRAIHFERSNTQ